MVNYTCIVDDMITLSTTKDYTNKRKKHMEKAKAFVVTGIIKQPQPVQFPIWAKDEEDALKVFQKMMMIDNPDDIQIESIMDAVEYEERLKRYMPEQDQLIEDIEAVDAELEDYKKKELN